VDETERDVEAAARELVGRPVYDVRYYTMPCGMQLRIGLRQGQPAGLQLINAGLGPAVITRTVLTLDGESLGEFSEASVNMLRSKLSIRPAAVPFRKTTRRNGSRTQRRMICAQG